VPAIGRPQKVLKPGSILKAGLHDPSTCSSDMRSKSNILSDSICCKHSLVKALSRLGVCVAVRGQLHADRSG
jgi:hypothetical protein